MNMAIYIFLVVQLFLFFMQNICYLKIEAFQYIEMVSGGVFIIIVFGLIGQKLLTGENILFKSIIFASIFSIWYYFTKYFTNLINKDINGVIHWN